MWYQTTKSHPIAQVAPSPVKPLLNLIVGIGGSSCSGKTRLAVALAAIFQEHYDITLATQPAKIPRIISQDAYFVPKPLCPTTLFRPILPADVGILNHESVSFDGEGRIISPDTDCLAAVDWEHLREDVQPYLDPPSSIISLRAAAIPLPSSPILHTHPADPSSIDVDVDECSARQQRLQLEIDQYMVQFQRLGRLTKEAAIKTICKCEAEQERLNREVGFEGKHFGGWVEKRVDSAGRTLRVSEREEGRGWQRARLVLVEGYGLFAKGGGNGMQGEGAKKPPTSAEENGQEIVSELCAQMHVRLYLNTDKALAKKRRFERAVYRDACPGELWKTEGYFEDVVWPNHVKHHEHLHRAIEDDVAMGGGRPDLGNDVLHEGICVRGAANEGWDYSVRWAVNCIMHRMVELEAKARGDFVAMMS